MPITITTRVNGKHSVTYIHQPLIGTLTTESFCAEPRTIGSDALDAIISQARAVGMDHEGIRTGLLMRFKVVPPFERGITYTVMGREAVA